MSAEINFQMCLPACRHDVNGHMTYWLQTPAAAEEGALGRVSNSLKYKRCSFFNDDGYALSLTGGKP